MSKDLKGKRASLWHAYTALQEQGKGKENAVAKGQLKVLTHSLATRVGLADVGNQLDAKFDSVDSIGFDDYADFLAGALFDRLADGSAGSVGREAALDGVDEVCWYVCGKTYCVGQKRLINAEDAYKLWRIFNVVAETTSDDDDLREPGAEAAVPVTAHAEEVELLVQRLGAILRTPVAYDAAGRASDFAAFLRTIERKCLAEKNAGVVSSAVGELYDDIIDNVLKKGYLYRRRAYGVTVNNEREWYVLTPTRLCVYSGRDVKDKKTELVISKACQVVDLPDKAGRLGSIGIGIGIGVKTNRFTVRFSDDSSKPIELYADDAHTKSEWLQAFRTAAQWSGGIESSPHGVELKKRRAARLERRARERDELQRKKDEDERMQKTLKELEEQRQAREEAEHQCREDEQRIAELKQLHQQLEQLLELERQAKRDEEIVRSLQANVLQEEFEKREQLEELKESLEELLQLEQVKSSELEEKRRLQEQMLAEEQQRLEKLEQERQLRDQQYEMAVAKLSEAERAKAEMEEALKRKEQEMQKRTGARFLASRLDGGQDFVPRIVSHRGLGAFPRAETTWSGKATDGTPSNSECPATSTSEKQVPVPNDDAAATTTVAGDAASPAVDSGCPPSAVETKDNTPPAVVAEQVRPAPDDAGQTDEQPDDEAPSDNQARLENFHSESPEE